MNLIVFVPGLNGFFISLGLGIYILASNLKSRKHQLFALLMIIQAVWFFIGLRLQTADDFELANRWLRATSFIPFMYVIFYHLMLHLTNQRFSFFHTVSLILNYIFAYGFFLIGLEEQSLIGDLVRAQWGWDFIIDSDNFFYALYATWRYSIIIAVFMYSLVFIIRQKNPFTRNQTVVFLIGVILPTAFESIATVLFPEINVPSFPFTNAVKVIGSLFIAISIIRSKAFVINPTLAALTVFNSVQDGIVLCDENWMVLEVNTGAESLYERNDLTGKRIDVLIPELEDHGWQAAAISPELDIDQEIDLVTHSGQRKTVGYRMTAMKSKSRVIGAVVVLRDLTKRLLWETEKREMRERLFQKQKLESIGFLAGGIAHDFNNALGSIQMVAENLKAKAENPKTEKAADTILDAAQYAEDLTGRLLDFARQEKADFSQIDLHEILQRVHSMCRHTFPASIEINIELNAESSLVYGNAQELQAAFLNICINARDAVRDNGTILVSTKQVQKDRKLAASRKIGIESASSICVSISDDGIGMDSITQSKIFDPFFTTKAVGKGTGLGLSSVYGTVRNHDGRIDLHSVPGYGTTFNIYLPELLLY
jgi:PAS domain S-box-containing protein